MERLTISQALRRGWQRRCPRCGEGALFEKRIEVLAHCPVCHLRYQGNNGDTWMFMMITDRIPLLLGIAIVYFGFHPEGWPAILGFFGALAAPLLITIRQRQGVALALDYLVGTWLREPAEQMRVEARAPSSTALDLH